MGSGGAGTLTGTSVWDVRIAGVSFTCYVTPKLLFFTSFPALDNKGGMTTQQPSLTLRETTLL